MGMLSDETGNLLNKPTLKDDDDKDIEKLKDHKEILLKSFLKIKAE